MDQTEKPGRYPEEVFETQSNNVAECNLIYRYRALAMQQMVQRKFESLESEKLKREHSKLLAKMEDMEKNRLALETRIVSSEAQVKDQLVQITNLSEISEDSRIRLQCSLDCKKV